MRLGRLQKIRGPSQMPAGVLVWKDGRRQPTEHAGAIRIHYPWKRPDGRIMDTVFVSGNVQEGDPEWLYHEEHEEDVTARTREAHARFEWEEAQRRGWRSRFSGQDQGFLPGETVEEQRRRINIEKHGVPELPTAAGKNEGK